MSSGGSIAEATLGVAGGASLRVALPRAAKREPEGALPPVDVANLPGATVPIRAGFQGDHETLRVVCATAPSRGWAPGVEQIVLARASQIARGALGGEVTRFEVSDVAAIGDRFEQRFEATLERDGASFSARGRHLLGFSGEAQDALVCSVVCVERAGGEACGALVDAARAESGWTRAPAPSLAVRTILLAADRPMEAGAIAAVVMLVIVTWVIARRPRPRAR